MTQQTKIRKHVSKLRKRNEKTTNKQAEQETIATKSQNTPKKTKHNMSQGH